MSKVFHLKSILFIFCLLGCSNLFGQEFLVKDINPGAGWSGIELQFRIDNQFYFIATGDLGLELWVSDGTADGTTVLKDINPDPFQDSSPAEFTQFNGLWFFTADDGINGREIWSTDGTTEGTQLFKDINIGGTGSDPVGLTVINGSLYFSANDGESGKELWKSDGTSVGTSMIADIASGVNGSSPEFMTPLGDLVVFAANDGSFGKEIWKTDGTEVGTSMIKDIMNDASSSFPTELTSVADKVYFIADDGVFGKEIWRTDGTEGGTVLTADIVSGNAHPQASDLNAVGDYLFFVADNDTNGVELFRSDATADPMVELVEIFQDTFGSTPTEFIMMNGDLFFNANSGVEGYEIWKASANDGVVEIVKDILPGFESSSPKMLAVLNNNLIFAARGEGIGHEIWRTDGTEAGTILLGDLNTDPSTDLSNSYPQLPFVKDNVLYFTATDYINGYQIWRTDGSSSSTQRVTSIPHDTIFDNTHKPIFINNIGNEIINFVGLSTPVGEELWGEEIDPITISSVQTNSPLNCNGDSNGTIDLTITGGVGDPSCFDYSWSEPGLSGLSVSNLSAGAYTITVTDCVGFETISTINIEEPNLVSAIIEQTSSVSCNGQSDGQAAAAGEGGTAPYNYLWDNGQTGAIATGLNAGIHTVTITDNNGCTGVETILITEPSVLNASASASSEICFGGNDGIAEVIPTGGTPGYTYLWDNGAESSTATNLNGGNHTVTVTDLNGCTTTSAVTIAEMPQIEIEIATQHVSCIEGDNGAATVMSTGGSGAGYTYLWTTGATTEMISGLAGGDVCVTVTDSNGCTNESCVTIFTPEVSVNVDGNVSCFGGMNGSASVNITNANSNYTYLWDNGEITATATMLPPGLHTVTVTDELLCSTVESVTLTEATAFVFSDSLSGSPSCSGANNGFISYNFSGGTTPYSYSWSTGAMTTTGTLGGLSGNETYCATVTDAFGCETFIFCSTLTEPEGITADLMSSADVSCFGACNGAALVEVTGGAGGMDLTFAWSSGETNTGGSSLATNLCAGENFVTITNGSCSVVQSVTIGSPDQIVPTIAVVDASCFGASDGSVSATVIGGTMPYDLDFSGGTSNLPAGLYTLVVTDGNGCTSIQSFTVGQADEIALSYAIQTPSCIGDTDGSVTAVASGGSGPYSYDFSEGPDDLSAGTYTVTVTDANMCSTVDAFIISDPSPVEISSDVSNISCFGNSDGSVIVDASGGTGPYTFDYSDDTEGLAAGTYMVTATDANGCISIDSFTISEPEELVTNLMVTDISCFGNADGSVTASANGGTMPYDFDYENGSDDLLAGLYFVTTTDANGCSNIDSFMINEPPLLVVGYTVVDVSCFGGNDGSVVIDISGGTAPYEYDGIYTDLSAGVYSLLVMDANGCTVEEVITVGQPDEIIVTTSSTDATGMDADGTASVLAEGGIMPYSYQWNSDPMQNTETAIGLVAGDYMVTVTDANGCTSVETVTVGSFVNTSELDESLKFKLFPNPVNQSATLSFEFSEVKDIKIKVYNALGQIVFLRSLDEVQNGQISINVEKYSQGIYWIYLNAEDGHFVRKLSVTK